MAIADTVWERLARFNAPQHRARRAEYSDQLRDAAAVAARWLALAGLWLLVAISTLAALSIRLARWAAPRIARLLWALTRFTALRVVPWTARAGARLVAVGWYLAPGLALAVRFIVLGAVLGLLGRVAYDEINSSHLQTLLFTRLDRSFGTQVEAGPSPAIMFPKGGPYDARLGYAELPDFLASLKARNFTIDSQARWTPGLQRFVKTGAFPVYREKDEAGLRIFDRNGDQLYAAQFPERVYPDFATIPGVVINSLLFIEDRYLLDPAEPHRNPAVEWKRFALAAAARLGSLVVPGLREGGGSTLATQIEKFRHSPQGLTEGVGEKLRQMLTASARAYLDGPDTMQRRRAIIKSYLNSAPYSSMPGYGEVIGVPEALWIWFGTDYVEASRILASTPRTATEWARKGETYREVLGLLLSERRPSYYLLTNRDALEALTDKYLGILCDAGVIDPQLRDAALAASLHFRDGPPPIAAVTFNGQKATEEVRNKLVSMLKLPDLYALDRLDLSAQAAVDTAAQARVSSVLQRLSDRHFVSSLGMVGHQLLGDGDPAKVTWSFVLYERGAERNFVRIHADSLNKAFDINSGGKLQLGSTAKLRTMITYLDIMADLHERFAGLPARQLSRLAASAQDPLTGWAASYLARSRDRSLQPMLDAAMQRTYSAAAGTFFTGGGTQSFGNFESSENYETPTVETAFQHSINLAFIRLLHDIVTYESVASGVQIKELLGNPDDPQRQAFLQRFVDADSRRFLGRFYKDYKGLSGDDALDRLVRRTQPLPKRMATVYLSIHPDARIAHLQEFLNAHLPHEVISENELWDLYLNYSPERLNLADRGYVSGIHPLELWLVRYLNQHPGASWDDVVQASTKVRQEVYAWLFNGSTAKQDTRIRILLEQDAFERILDNWQELGYPFGHLVPSLGTAIGASGDRPDALADLMGIIVHDGVRVPTVSIQQLHFASGTPYETNLSPAAKPERVMPVEVARTVRRALMGVVTDGTAARLRGTYTAADGSPLPVGGKTGTGDNRFDRFGRGGGMISSRVVDRTATFVFFLGDRFFGTVTAYVPGPDAARFHFTSALAVQLLKALQPELKPLIDAPAGAPTETPAASAALVGSSQPSAPDAGKGVTAAR